MTDDDGRREPGPVPDNGPVPASRTQAQPGEGADLLSIGLLVFFVALLLIVAAMLTLPMVLG
jgi:hypothetical protein